MTRMSVYYWVILLLALGQNNGDALPMQLSSFYMYPNGRPQEGSTLTLICYLDPSPAAPFQHPTSYVWVKDGSVIPGQTGVNLTFTQLAKQDEGEYQCGDPGLKVARWTYQLNVNSRLFSVSAQSTSVSEAEKLPQSSIFHHPEPLLGQEFVLNCVFEGGYTPSENTRYVWYKNSTQVKVETSPLLRFPNLTKTDNGEYQCTAWERSPATMSPPSPVFNLKARAPHKGYFKPASSDPMVLGKNVILTCMGPQGSPPVSTTGYSWSFLPLNQKHRQLLEERSSTLTLSPLTRNHSGQYQCQARNDHDFPAQNPTEPGIFTVDVVYLENISLTHYLEVSEGEPLTLTCTVDSHPTAYLTWTVDGKDGRHVTSNLDHYTIPSTSCSDSGNYTCHANNTKVPGQELVATTHVNVLCSQVMDSSKIAVVVVAAVLWVMLVVIVIVVYLKRRKRSKSKAKTSHHTYEQVKMKYRQVGNDESS